MARYLHGFYSLVCLRQQCDGNATEKEGDKALVAENVCALGTGGDGKNDIGHTQLGQLFPALSRSYVLSRSCP